MEQLGHQLLVGDAAEIRRLARRRQKNDRRDAHLLLRRIATVKQWLKEQANRDLRVLRLQTHPGVGLLTSLCLVHTLSRPIRYKSCSRQELLADGAIFRKFILDL